MRSGRVAQSRSVITRTSGLLVLAGRSHYATSIWRVCLVRSAALSTPDNTAAGSSPRERIGSSAFGRVAVSQTRKPGEFAW